MNETQKPDRKTCEECGKTIHGRLDKRFCDANCRNAFNNKLKRSDEQYILATNRILRKNRRILKTLSPLGKSTVRKEVIEAMGYNFNTFSSMHRSPKGLIYYLCYDFGFSPIIDSRGIQKAIIINRQDYMNKWQPWQYVNK
jgi:predicted nucleic acid-binding Zn ribbon protein